MTTITNAAHVRSIFPNVTFTDTELSSNQGSDYLLGRHGSIRLDGDFTPEQVLALAYWVTHKAEFADA